MITRTCLLFQYSGHGEELEDALCQIIDFSSFKNAACRKWGLCDPYHLGKYKEGMGCSWISDAGLNLRTSLRPCPRPCWGQVGTFVSFSRFLSDRETWNIDRQFLLGPAFLVSPVLEAVSMETRGSKDSI